MLSLIIALTIYSRARDDKNLMNRHLLVPRAHTCLSSNAVSNYDTITLQASARPLDVITLNG